MAKTVFNGAAILGCVLLSACGSSDSTKTGYFEFGGIQGLEYQTESRSGKTTSGGAFKYESGETIQFSIGGIQIGEAIAAKSSISPFDIVSGATMPTSSKAFETLDDEGGAAVEAFDHVVNILAVLQSLDSDKNFDNGIELDVRLVEALSAASIDFESNFDNFYENKDIRGVVYQAFNEGFIDNAWVVPGARALSDYFQDQGIATAYIVQTKESEDENADDTVDNIYSMTLDIDGNVVFSDDGGDCRTRVFNERNQTLESAFDSSCDETIDQTKTYQYDLHGNLISQANDTDGDGTDDEVQTWVYDQNGNGTLYERRDGEGVLTYAWSKTYDSNSNLLVYEQDQDGNGEADFRRSYTYDDSGNTTSYQQDQGADGVIESAWERTYDENGRELKNTSYSNGVVTDIVQVSWTVSGKIESELFDTDGDGVWDEKGAYQYDASDNLILGTFEITDSGEFIQEYDEIYAYEYDANGNETRLVSDYDGDGNTDYLSVSAYNQRSQLLSRSQDFNGDSQYDRVYTYEYDADGNKIKEERDTNGDGVVDLAYMYSYDAEGNRIKEERDMNGDGTFELAFVKEFDEQSALIFDATDIGNDGEYESYSRYEVQATTFHGFFNWWD